MVITYNLLICELLFVGPFRRNQERSQQLHQEDWLQPSCCCFRSHLWMEWRQHVGSFRQDVVVQRMEC
jgi:hypothetical protein